MGGSLPQWQLPPATLELVGGEVHVWRAGLDLPHWLLHSLELILDSDERTRVEKMHFEQARARFIASRGLLRLILERYLNTPAQVLRFSSNRHGKPYLADHTAGDLPLFFNVSHSQQMALYAVAAGMEIGVDIEYVRADMEYESIAEHFFSPYEVSKLREVPVDQRSAAFFRCWTRKEAYMKARGMGLALDLHLFDVSVSPEEPAALLETREEGQPGGRWSLRDLPAIEGYAAALAVEGKPRLQCWVWPETSGTAPQ